MTIEAGNIPESWLTLLGGRDASGWLGAFVASSKKAVADLLWDAFHFGPLNLTERGQLLAGWLDQLGNTERFAETLDAELTLWIEENWGRYDHTAESLASAWSCLCSIVESSSTLDEDSRLKSSAAALRARFAARQRFLGSFSTAPAADPLGQYLAVVAEFQGEDRSLAGFWHRMCDLPDDVPFYHARYAMLGLRRMKAADSLEDGTLRAEIVLGLIHLARAFDRLLERDRGLPEQILRATFRRVAVQTAAAYPISPRWREHGLSETLELPERAQRWLLQAVPPLAEAVRRVEHRPVRSIRPDSNWPGRARELAARLRSGDRICLPEVNELLEEQRRYAQATGDTYFVVRTLCQFASRALNLEPQLSLQWAEEAREWEPDDAFTWTTSKDVLLKLREVTYSLRIAWVAWKRFPDNVVARSGLAEVLKAANRYDEAEQVYRESVERFPDNVVARNGLAEVLKATHRYDEAEQVYREAVERFPNNVFTRSGLAEVVKAANRYDEAEQVYRESVERFPDNVVARNGLAEVLKATHRYGEAEQVYREAVERFPNDVVTRSGLAEVLKATHRYDEAEQVYRESVERFPDNVVARNGLAEVLKAAHRYDEAEQVYREAVERFPNNVITRSGLADTLRRSGRWDEAEDEYRHSIEDGFVSEVSLTGLAYLVLRKGEAGRAEALDLLGQVLKLDPHNSYALSLKDKLMTASAESLDSVMSELSEVADHSLEGPTFAAEGQQAADDEREDALPTDIESDGDEIWLDELTEEPLLETEPTPSVHETGRKARPVANRNDEIERHQFTKSDSLEVAALVAEAYFYRTWAKGLDDDHATARRQMAAGCIAQAEQLAPQDPQVLAEAAALTVDRGNEAVAFQDLTIQLSSHAAAIPLLMLKARLDRERARRESRPLSDSALAELCAIPKRLLDLNPSFDALFNFQKGLASLALVDGTVRRETAARSFSSFRRTLAHRASEEKKEREHARDLRLQGVPRFHEWLQQQTNRRLFSALSEPEHVHVDDIPFVERALAEHQGVVTEVEDVFADRIVFRAI
jgi:tetratricopeptide (TPR) repeat protein